MDETFYPVVRADALVESEVISRNINGRPIAIASFDGKLTAFWDVCPHAGAQLSGGRVRRGRIFCPLHGAPFNLETGVCMAPQRYAPLKMVRVRVRDDWVEVAVADEATPGPSDGVA